MRSYEHPHICVCTPAHRCVHGCKHSRAHSRTERTHARMHAPTRTTMHARIHAPTHVPTHAHTRILMHSRSRTHPSVHAPTYTCTHARTRPRTHAPTHLLPHTYAQVRACILATRAMDVAQRQNLGHGWSAGRWRACAGVFVCTCMLCSYVLGYVYVPRITIPKTTSSHRRPSSMHACE